MREMILTARLGVHRLYTTSPSPASGPSEMGDSRTSSSLPTRGSSSPFMLEADPALSSSRAKEPWRDFLRPKKVVSVGRRPDPSPSGTPEPLSPPDTPAVVITASSSDTGAGPTQASTTPLCFAPLLSVSAPVLRFCRWRQSRSSARRTMTTSMVTSTAISRVFFVP